MYTITQNINIYAINTSKLYYSDDCDAPLARASGIVGGLGVVGRIVHADVTRRGECLSAGAAFVIWRC